MQLAAREAAVERIWDSAVVEPANSLINFGVHSGENAGHSFASAHWQAQGNSTRTHSDIVMPCSQLSVYAVCCIMLANYMT